MNRNGQGPENKGPGTGWKQGGCVRPDNKEENTWTGRRGRGGRGNGRGAGCRGNGGRGRGFRASGRVRAGESDVRGFEQEILDRLASLEARLGGAPQ